MKMVTIIVPIYNTEQYLDECINSLVNQSYKELEIILINDGSTDSSGAVCRKWMELDPRIRYIETENQGQGKARTLGITYARGNYILFVDSDDYIEFNLIESVNCYMEQKRADVCIFAYQCVGEQTMERIPLAVKVQEPVTTHICKQFLCQLSPLICNKMYSTELLKKISHKMENTMCEDLLFLSELFVRAERIVTWDAPLYYYRYMRNGNMSTDFHRYGEVLINVEKMMELFRKEQWFQEYWRELYSISFNIFKDILFRLHKRKDLRLPLAARNQYASYLTMYEHFYEKYFEKYIYANAMKMNYLLIGGYNLRGIIRDLLLEEERLVDHYAASSVVSLMSKSLDKRIIKRITTENWYRITQICIDINKNFMLESPFRNIDCVVIDFIEECSDLFEIEGAFFTESEFLKDNCILEDHIAGKRVHFLSRRRRTLFQNAIEKMVEIFRSNHILVILVKNYLNTRYSDVYDDFSYFKDGEIELKNQELSWCYEMFLEKMPESVCVDGTKFTELAFTYKNFPFGCKPIYANNGYFKYMATEIGEKLKLIYEQKDNSERNQKQN